MIMHAHVHTRHACRPPQQHERERGIVCISTSNPFHSCLRIIFRQLIIILRQTSCLWSPFTMPCAFDQQTGRSCGRCHRASKCAKARTHSFVLRGARAEEIYHIHDIATTTSHPPYSPTPPPLIDRLRGRSAVSRGWCSTTVPLFLTPCRHRFHSRAVLDTRRCRCSATVHKSAS